MNDYSNIKEINQKNINEIKNNVRKIHEQIKRIKKVYYHATGNIEPFDKILSSFFGKSNNKHCLSIYERTELANSLYQLMNIFNLKFMKGNKNDKK